jgi:hypothetical protein
MPVEQLMLCKCAVVIQGKLSLSNDGVKSMTQ